MEQKTASTGWKFPYLPKVKRIFGTLSIFLLSLCAFSQTVVQPKQLDYSSVGVLYNKEKSLDFRAHTNGLAVGVHFGTIKTFYKTNYYQFDLGILRHPKEFRQTITFNSGSPFTRSSGSFTYGKQNQFIVLRGGIGKKIYFSDKAKRKGVAVGVDYEFGPSIGLLKPYYLNLTRLQENGFVDYISTERYSEENKDIFLDETKIVGPASFFKGFGQLTAMPGLHARLGAHFSLGAFEEFVKAFEVGVMVDAYFKRVPIMIIENNTPMFINGYVSFQIGKRE
jgi:hypothetical protein